MQEEADEVQDCKILADRYAVTLEPAIFLSPGSVKALNSHLEQNYEHYKLHNVTATTGLSYEEKSGYNWTGNLGQINESIEELIEKFDANKPCYKFFLSNSEGN